MSLTALQLHPGWTDVRWRQGKETSLSLPCSNFELKVFREQLYCVENGTCDIVATFWAPPVIWRLGHCAPSYPLGPSLHLPANCR